MQVPRKARKSAPHFRNFADSRISSSTAKEFGRSSVEPQSGTFSLGIVLLFHKLHNDPSAGQSCLPENASVREAQEAVPHHMLSVARYGG